MWTWEQTGSLIDPEGHFACSGYAGGFCGLNPEGVNNPSMQDRPMIGPLPRGRYLMAEFMEKHPRLGKSVIRLQPFPGNEMFGRAGFFLHGDRIGDPGKASDGCIIIPLQNRLDCWNSTDHILEVVSGREVSDVVG